MDPIPVRFGAPPQGPFPLHNRGNVLIKTNSGSSWNGEESPASAAKVAAAHNAQMDAMLAAARADYDAEVAELMADLEGTRGEKEKAETDLAFLKTSSRKERLEWNKDRTLLKRKVAEAEARAREAADSVASPEEFTALQEALANNEATIGDLRKKLAEKEVQQEKMRFEVACASTAEADVARLMVCVASLEQNLAEERDARKAAQEEAEARRAEVRGLDRRLGAALEAAARAEDDAATCVEDVARAATEVREARTCQRHAELWLEKSLGEVDAVHAMLSYERSSGFGMTGTGGGCASPAAVQGSVCLPPPPPSPAFFGTEDGGGSVCGSNVDGRVREVAVVGPTLQTPQPESSTAQVVPRVDCCGGGGGVGVAAIGDNGAKVGVVGSPAGRSTKTSTSTSTGSVHGDNLRTPDADATCKSLPFSAPTAAGTRSRPRLGGREMELRGDETATTVGMSGSSEERGRHFGRGARDGGSCSPPIPTVLFGEPADGQGLLATTTREGRGRALSSAGMQCDFSSAKGEANNTGTRTEDGAAFHLSQQLRLEVSRREKAEARNAALEKAASAATAAAAASAAAAAAAEAAATAAQHKAVGMRDLAAATRASGTLGGRADGSVDMCTRIAPHGYSGGKHANFVNASVGDDAHAYFAKLDHERQTERIAGLVREARSKMNPPKVGKGVGSRRGGANGRGTELAAPGSFPNVDSSSSTSRNESQVNLAHEVASLIEQLEGQVSKSVTDNAQLRDFCTHLEGLLAAREDRGLSARADPPAVEGFPVGRRRVLAAGTSVDSKMPRRVKPFAEYSQSSLGEARKGLPWPGSFQELC